MRIVAILAILALAACQTRQANPVSLSQSGDERLDCASIQVMQQKNREEAARLAKLDEGVAMGNAFAVAMSQAWIFWPAVLGVDLSDAEEIEMRALRDRNRRLAEIGRGKGCRSVDETAGTPRASG